MQTQGLQQHLISPLGNRSGVASLGLAAVRDLFLHAGRSLFAPVGGE